MHSYCTTADIYISGGSTSMCWTCFNGGTDSEWLTDIQLAYPSGWTVACLTQDASDSGTHAIAFACTAAGETVSYSDSDGGYGEVYEGESWGFCITVTAPAVSGAVTVNYQIDGDGWGAGPHTISDTESIVPVELTGFSVE